MLCSCLCSGRVSLRAGFSLSLTAFPLTAVPKKHHLDGQKLSHVPRDWEVIKEMESNQVNFTRAEEKLLQYLVPVLEPNSYIKTSSSTLRKNQVSSLQITDSCWKWTQLTTLILFLNHPPWHLPSNGFSQNKAESWCFMHETGFITTDSHLVLANTSREHQDKTCKEIFFERWNESFPKETRVLHEEVTY